MKSRSCRLSILVAVLAAMVPVLGGCAYLNTFYNARVAFDSAWREHRKLMRGDPDSLVLPSGPILVNYDRAIAKSEKMLDVYPRSKKWVDDAFFLIGRALLNKGEYLKAARRFQQLLDEYPGSPYVPQATLLMGEAFLYDGNLTSAETILNTVLARYPQLNRNEEVSLLLARIAIQRDGRMQAIELLGRVQMANFPDEKRIDLIIRLAQLNMDLKQYGKAIDLLNTAPRKKKLADRTYRVDMLLLTCYLESGDLRTAFDKCEAMRKNRNYDQFENAIALRRGEILVRLGKTAEAIEQYLDLTRGGDTSEAAKRAWFQLGNLYQKNKGDYVKARECYLKSVGSQDTALVRIARQRIDAMAMLDTLRARSVTPSRIGGSAPKDTVDSLHNPVYREFRISELFWLQLDQADSAYKHYTGLSADTLTPSGSRSRALYSAGYLALNALKDTVRADSIFKQLADRYPQSEYSKKSQEDRGRPVTIVLRCDSAEAAFRDAEKKWCENDSAPAAVEAYLAVDQNFADCREIAAKSLYAAAWVCDNLLYKKKTAKTIYEKLCADFPGTEYCTVGAKPRLKTVLDSLGSRKSSSAPALRGVAPAPAMVPAPAVLPAHSAGSTGSAPILSAPVEKMGAPSAPDSLSSAKTVPSVGAPGAVGISQKLAPVTPAGTSQPFLPSVKDAKPVPAAEPDSIFLDSIR